MKSKFYRPVLYGALIALKSVFLFLPYAWGFSFGGTVGKFCFVVLKKERQRTLTHLKAAFGSEKSDAELQAIAKGVFEHYGKTLAEWALIEKLIHRLDYYVRSEGLQHYDETLAKGKGGVIVLAHFGNWELGGGYTSLKGYPATAIARKLYYNLYNDLLMWLRHKFKVHVIYRDESPRHILAALKKNRFVGIAADQDVDRVDGVFVEFFGKPAYTPSAPARLAMTTGAALIPAFIVREGRNGMFHRVIVEKPIELTDTGNKDEDLRVNTQKWVDIQEAYIRRYPEQWVWNHRRWKSAAGSGVS